MIAALLLSLCSVAAPQGATPPAPILWESLPPVPDPVGLGGPFVAALQGADGEQRLLVAGGANFPEAPPWEGGAKVWYAGTWVFDGEGWASGPPLPGPRAYGAVVHLDGRAVRADEPTRLSSDESSEVTVCVSIMRTCVTSLERRLMSSPTRRRT